MDRDIIHPRDFICSSFTAFTSHFIILPDWSSWRLNCGINHMVFSWLPENDYQMCWKFSIQTQILAEEKKMNEQNRKRILKQHSRMSLRYIRYNTLVFVCEQ